jgi:hypothetical protein
MMFSNIQAKIMCLSAMWLSVLFSKNEMCAIGPYVCLLLNSSASSGFVSALNQHLDQWGMQNCKGRTYKWSTFYLFVMVLCIVKHLCHIFMDTSYDFGVVTSLSTWEVGLLYTARCLVGPVEWAHQITSLWSITSPSVWAVFWSWSENVSTCYYVHY